MISAGIRDETSEWSFIPDLAKQLHPVFLITHQTWVLISCLEIMIFLYLYGSFKSQLGSYYRMRGWEICLILQLTPNGPVSAQPTCQASILGFSLCVTEVAFLWFPQEPFSNWDLSQSLQLCISACVCVAVCLGEEKDAARSSRALLRELTRQRWEEKKNQRNKSKRKGGEIWPVQGPQNFDCQPCLWINKVKLDEKPQQSSSEAEPGSPGLPSCRAKCSFVFKDTASWATVQYSYGRAAKEDDRTKN